MNNIYHILDILMVQIAYNWVRWVDIPLISHRIHTGY